MNEPVKITQGEPLVEAQTRIVIYTDGACLGNPGPGGWAAIIRRYNADTEIDLLPITGGESQTTNNRMEMRAAIAALGTLPSGEVIPISVLTACAQPPQKAIQEFSTSLILDWKLGAT
jgi:ribonuclease HI